MKATLFLLLLTHPPHLVERKKATTPLRDIPSSEANFSQVVTYAAAAAALQNRGSTGGNCGRSGGGGGSGGSGGGGGSAQSSSGSGGGGSSEAVEEEEWCLSEVIFLEDRGCHLGRVLKTDGNIVAVRFADPRLPAAAAAPAIEGAEAGDPRVALLADCRLLKRDDLALVRNPFSARFPDFYQRTPRRVPLPPALCCLPGGLAAAEAGAGGQHTVLAMSVTNADLHLIVRSNAGGSSTKLSYQVYSLFGKHLQSLRLMTHPPAFTGRSVDNVRLLGPGDVEVSVAPSLPALVLVRESSSFSL